MRLLFPVFLLACAPGVDPTPDAPDAPDAFDPLALDVLQPGPFRLGHREIEVSYDPVPGLSRTLPVAVFYPTDATEGAAVRFADMLPAPDIVLGDAPPAAELPASGRRPVALYSHGDRAFGGAHAQIAAHLVSHGWVVLAPYHVGNLLWADDDDERAGHWYRRPLDLHAALTALDDAPDLHADPDQVLVAGHSRGATTVWTLAGATFDPARQDEWCGDCTPAEQALFTDLALPEARAFAFLDGGGRDGLFGSTGYDAVTAPLLALTVPDAGFWSTYAGPPATWVTFDGACHETFNLGLCTTFPEADGWRLTGAYLTALGRRHLLGDTTPLVLDLTDGAATPDPRLTATAVP